tara:strand:- start:1198 stop:1383 length:186 start_codon:yes stop_codon:yes gene_type:complete
MEELYIACELNERAIRALHSAVAMTLEKWTGQGEVDQEELFKLKHFLQGAIFEFDLGRSLK